MTRWIWTAVIVALLALALGIPYTGMGRRGTDPEPRTDVETSIRVGQKLPPLEFEDLEGQRVRLDDLRGHRVLITFERSVDW